MLLYVFDSSSNPSISSLSISSICTISHASLSVGVTFMTSNHPCSSSIFSTAGFSPHMTKKQFFRQKRLLYLANFFAGMLSMALTFDRFKTTCGGSLARQGTVIFPFLCHISSDLRISGVMTLNFSLVSVLTCILTGITGDVKYSKSSKQSCFRIQVLGSSDPLHLSLLCASYPGFASW